MSSPIPSLPQFNQFPYLTDAVIGFLCGKIGQTDPKLSAIIFATRGIANTLFFQIANTLLDAQDIKSQRVFVYNATIVNFSLLVILNELNIIGKLSSFLLTLSIIGSLVGRIIYIQKKESEAIQNQLHGEGGKPA